jgi:hypothetical protein
MRRRSGSWPLPTAQPAGLGAGAVGGCAAAAAPQPQPLSACLLRVSSACNGVRGQTTNKAARLIFTHRRTPDHTRAVAAPCPGRRAPARVPVVIPDDDSSQAPRVVSPNAFEAPFAGLIKPTASSQPRRAVPPAAPLAADNPCSRPGSQASGDDGGHRSAYGPPSGAWQQVWATPSEAGGADDEERGGPAEAEGTPDHHLDPLLEPPDLGDFDPMVAHGRGTRGAPGRWGAAAAAQAACAATPPAPPWAAAGGGSCGGGGTHPAMGRAGEARMDGGGGSAPGRSTAPRVSRLARSDAGGGSFSQPQPSSGWDAHSGGGARSAPGNGSEGRARQQRRAAPAPVPTPAPAPHRDFHYPASLRPGSASGGSEASTPRQLPPLPASTTKFPSRRAAGPIAAPKPLPGSGRGRGRSCPGSRGGCSSTSPLERQRSAGGGLRTIAEGPGEGLLAPPEQDARQLWGEGKAEGGVYGCGTSGAGGDAWGVPDDAGTWDEERFGSEEVGTEGAVADYVAGHQQEYEAAASAGEAGFQDEGWQEQQGSPTQEASAGKASGCGGDCGDGNYLQLMDARLAAAEAAAAAEEAAAALDQASGQLRAAAAADEDMCAALGAVEAAELENLTGAGGCGGLPPRQPPSPPPAPPHLPLHKLGSYAAGLAASVLPLRQLQRRASQARAARAPGPSSVLADPSSLGASAPLPAAPTAAALALAAAASARARRLAADAEAAHHRLSVATGQPSPRSGMLSRGGSARAARPQVSFAAPAHSCGGNGGGWPAAAAGATAGAWRAAGPVGGKAGAAARLLGSDVELDAARLTLSDTRALAEALAKQLDDLRASRQAAAGASGGGDDAHIPPASTPAFGVGGQAATAAATAAAFAAATAPQAAAFLPAPADASVQEGLVPAAMPSACRHVQPAPGCVCCAAAAAVQAGWVPPPWWGGGQAAGQLPAPAGLAWQQPRAAAAYGKAAGSGRDDSSGSSSGDAADAPGGFRPLGPGGYSSDWTRPSMAGLYSSPPTTSDAARGSGAPAAASGRASQHGGSPGAIACAGDPPASRGGAPGPEPSPSPARDAYFIPSVLRAVVGSPEGRELTRRLDSAEMTQHQRCLRMLEWAFEVYRQMPRSALQVCHCQQLRRVDSSQCEAHRKAAGCWLSAHALSTCTHARAASLQSAKQDGSRLLAV